MGTDDANDQTARKQFNIKTCNNICSFYVHVVQKTDKKNKCYTDSLRLKGYPIIVVRNKQFIEIRVILSRACTVNYNISLSLL